MAKKLFLFCLVAATFVVVLCEVNSTRSARYCQRPVNIVKVNLTEFQGTWYFVRTVNYKDQVYNARCIRGQFGVQPGGWSGVASWVSLQRTTNRYRNDLYEIWQSEPGMVDFQGLGNRSVTSTYYILKFVPKERALISVCYKTNGVFLDQIYSYYIYGSPTVDERVMDNDYREAGIRIRNSMTIPQNDPDCFRQE